MKNLRILKASSIVARLDMHFSELMVSRFFSYHPGVRVLRALLVGVASNGNPSETAENLLPVQLVINAGNRSLASCTMAFATQKFPLQHLLRKPGCRILPISLPLFSSPRFLRRWA